MAFLVSSFASHSSVQTEYCCERGYLRLNKRWFAPTQITIWENGWEGEQTIMLDKPPGNGYQFEAAHVMKCLDEGKIESDMMSLQTSLDLMEVLDMVRKDAGIVFAKHD
jgi:predicted dehydrogenase